MFSSVKADTEDKYALMKSITDSNDDLVTIHTIGMGPFVDENFLGKMSACNGGSAIHIPDNLDAGTQVLFLI